MIISACIAVFRASTLYRDLRDGSVREVEGVIEGYRTVKGVVCGFYISGQLFHLLHEGEVGMGPRVRVMFAQRSRYVLEIQRL